ncbi:pyridoxamine 5'-phosphate oxidase family protein [Nitratiruptor tergarcus]|uniref:Pyridoxamine 5'-phosphate oxidase N-terminal domain-containing protein n=1 Tax=Nitratiruptor tergarcus DSM 16512 TaxID=1069081 RepID=A0A1W1WT28_9BACT|nr:pyridoxamine 5'-phosphate oxidase family protein [Nitratiruptor tergarcus]SMC08883.1 hypothetical protein SAMN05660197_0665 [Nitratiruptor tergarcus DSM 16512]
MEKKIEKFLENNHLLTLATCTEYNPYAANCFYAYDKEHKALIFASESHTHHMQDIYKNSKVAGTIALCEKEIIKIQGVQFIGIVESAAAEQKSLYYKRFPIALGIPSPLWAIHLQWIKMTDNTLGFKTKLIWTR